MNSMASIRLFRVAIHLWLLGYLLLALPSAQLLWYPGCSGLPAPPGLTVYLTHAFATWIPVNWAFTVALVLLLFVVRALLGKDRWWSDLIIWVLYTSLMNLAWLAASGGQQLIANVLFWMIFLPRGVGVRDLLGVEGAASNVGVIAFWMIRVQLLLAYGVTAVHKLIGLTWTTGQATGIVLTDPDYGPAFLAAFPAVTLVVTYATIIFQLGFPVAICWRPTRTIWLWAGLFFHLATGIGMGIPDMAFAFLACYTIWFDAGTSERILDRIRAVVPSWIRHWDRGHECTSQ